MTAVSASDSLLYPEDELYPDESVYPSTATIVLELNGETIENGTSVTWASGENTLTVTVTENGKEPTTYTVIVTKT